MSDSQSQKIADGVWPTMITPMKADGAVDFTSLDRLVDWFVEAEVAGLFAVCQSSEMFALELQERVAVAERVVERVAGRIGVIVSGNIAKEFSSQKEELLRLADVGANALVLVANRYVARDESDEYLRVRLEQVIEVLPEKLTLGLYECPYPYHRIVSAETLLWLASLERFDFLKDTSCDPEIQRARSQLLGGTSLRAFNANAATMLSSLRLGYAGYSGVMANFHPELYVWLCSNFREYPSIAEDLQNFLGVASVFEQQGYPMNAKHHLQQRGVLAHHVIRKSGPQELSPAQKIELIQLSRMAEQYRHGLPDGNKRTQVQNHAE